MVGKIGKINLEIPGCSGDIEELYISDISQ